MVYSGIYAIIAAAGKGLRVGGPVPKQLLRYGGGTVLEHTMRQFCTHDRVQAVIVVGPADGSLDSAYEEIRMKLAGEYQNKLIRIVRGGQERYDSVVCGLNAAAELAGEQGLNADDVCVMIHDAARPGVTHDVIDRNIDALETCQAAVTCIPSTDSIRIINEDSLLNNNSIYPIMESDIVNRNTIFNVQTPQTFCLSDIIRAYDTARADGFVGTDDASVASHAGINVAIVEGSPFNSKITTAKDVPMNTRVGTGFDVHKLVSERRLILCGTPVPYELGLLGHSDADVATHAIMDALLGAAGMGDIGVHFPDSDDKYKDANSLELLAEVKNIIGDYTITNIDVTIIAQRPKLAPYNEQMRNNIARTLDIPVSAVNVKATTTEGLGFTGTGEGIAAMATCAIEGRI
ncbi:MAG: 2-C-methyl-D-erythritol 2,4-cyclodiphosphate synthase [Clostridiales bacterium]|nr:2-C-methyl-D-erythritol 2,4-cyclodiphosphate synthase [Candidatus Crickella merdequi]